MNSTSSPVEAVTRLQSLVARLDAAREAGTVVDLDYEELWSDLSALLTSHADTERMAKVWHQRALDAESHVERLLLAAEVERNRRHDATIRLGEQTDGPLTPQVLQWLRESESLAAETWPDAPRGKTARWVLRLVEQYVGTDAEVELVRAANERLRAAHAQQAAEVGRLRAAITSARTHMLLLQQMDGDWSWPECDAFNAALDAPPPTPGATDAR